MKITKIQFPWAQNLIYLNFVLDSHLIHESKASTKKLRLEEFLSDARYKNVEIVKQFYMK
jgi:hypothetical protein